MNTRQLRHFLAVMDLGSLVAAAEAVHLSPPALSRSLRALEGRLRVPLFDRDDRRLKPTPYAEVYRERARRIVFDENESLRELALMREGEAGALAFGMGSSLGDLLGDLVLSLMQASPSLRLKTWVDTSDGLMSALQEERLDFFVGDVRIAEHRADTAFEPLHVCKVKWHARRGHPLTTRSRVTMDDLKAYPLAMTGRIEESLERKLAAGYGLTLPIEEHFAVSSSDLATVQRLMTTTDTVVSCTDYSALEWLRRGEAVQLKVLPAPDVGLTLGIVRLAGRTLAPAAEGASKLVRDHFRQAGAEVAHVTSRRHAAAR